MDLFEDATTILNYIDSNSYYAILREQISVYLPPEHPIIGKNRIQNGHHIAERSIPRLGRAKIRG